MCIVYNNDYFRYVVRDIYSLLLTVLKVSVKEDTGNEFSVTVRLYGPNTDLVIDRKKELQVRKNGTRLCVLQSLYLPASYKYSTMILELLLLLLLYFFLCYIFNFFDRE